MYSANGQRLSADGFEWDLCLHCQINQTKPTKITDRFPRESHFINSDPIPRQMQTLKVLSFNNSPQKSVIQCMFRVNQATVSCRQRGCALAGAAAPAARLLESPSSWGKNATVALWEKTEDPLLLGEGTDFQKPLAFKYCLNGFLMSCSLTLSR